MGSHAPHLRFRCFNPAFKVRRFFPLRLPHLPSAANDHEQRVGRVRRRDDRETDEIAQRHVDLPAEHLALFVRCACGVLASWGVVVNFVFLLAEDGTQFVQSLTMHRFNGYAVLTVLLWVFWACFDADLCIWAWSLLRF